jgi:uncharacterized protein (DUF427 family)
MSDRPVLQPGPDHPITVEPNPNHIVVTSNGTTIADTREALTLQEASYPAVFYIPLKDVDESLLERTDHSTYCPYKGEASYFSVPSMGEPGENVIWQYQEPYPSVSEIKDRVAFYANRVEITEAA